MVQEAVFHYDGLSWVNYINDDSVLEANVPYTALWGTSSSNLYLGNMYGKVIHWDGTKAKVILELGKYIQDIHGSSADNIWVVANNRDITYPVIASYNGFGWNIGTVSWDLFASAIYVHNKTEKYLAGRDIFYNRHNQWMSMGVNESTSFFDLNGININDFFAVGSRGKVYHYNGSTWKKFNGLAVTGDESYVGAFCAGNKVFIVGYIGSQGKILIGSKN